MSSEFDNQTTQPSAAAAATEAETLNEQSPATPEPAQSESEATAPPIAEPEAAAPVNGDEATAETMDALLEQYAKPQQAPDEALPVEGRVVAFTQLGAVVDIGGKNEGLIPASEFEQTGGALTVLPGEKVEVYVLAEHKEGYVLLSYLRALRRRIWENIEKSHRDGTALSGKILDRVKGGLVVDIGIQSFLPASQIEIRPTHDLERWKDQEISCRVIKMNRKRGNVVVSRRAILEEELRVQREKLLETLAEGAVLKGTVKNMTDYGVFVDLGGLDGLLHVTDISWTRVARPADVLHEDQEIEVKVLKFDREKLKVSLGMKHLQPDPFEGLAERLPRGARLQGKVKSVTDYGAFVELEPGVEGLVHVSEMSWSKRPQHPSKLVKVDDVVDVVVLEVKADQRRVSLGMKQTTEDPWHALAEKYPPGTVVTGEVRSLTEFGAFVEIEEGIDGMVHVSDISWKEKIKSPADVYKKGDKVECKVLKVDLEHRRISLGVKQLNDIWGNWFAAHKVGDLVKGKVTRSVEFGAFVQLVEDIEGLCHISEIEGRRRRDDEGGDKKPARTKKSGKTLEVGQEYDFKIVKMDSDKHKIGLSYRAAIRQAEKNEIAEYRGSKGKSTFTLGDMILSKRNSGL